MKAGLWTIAIIVLLVGGAIFTKPNNVSAGIAAAPKERLYTWDNVTGQYGTIVVFTDPQTLCRYLVGYRIGMTPRLTRSGKVDCPGVL